MKKIKNYIKKNENKFIKELISLLKIPSISADSEYKKEVNKMSFVYEFYICVYQNNELFYKENNIEHNALPTFRKTTLAAAF